MTYTAFSAKGPRIALAMSKDLLKWERLGLAKFAAFKQIKFNDINNKDACIFPQALLSPHGHSSMVMLHRPLFPGTAPEEIMLAAKDRRIRDHHECIWISYSHLNKTGFNKDKLPKFASNSPLALPELPWENLKIGAGTPPVLTKYGWLLLYHGVSQIEDNPSNPHQLVYSAGAMILDKDHPDKILYRLPKPVLTPELPEEKVGMIPNVVFPTGIDQRNDLGMPDRFDVYYGMADNKIGVAKLNLPHDFIKD